MLFLRLLRRLRPALRRSSLTGSTLRRRGLLPSRRLRRCATWTSRAVALGVSPSSVRSAMLCTRCGSVASTSSSTTWTRRLWRILPLLSATGRWRSSISTTTRLATAFRP
eukprot:Amastigsp_a339731_29.p4 type:complete len:110 gc:universal Amastigsp_a339731_29:1200-871(-)